MAAVDLYLAVMGYRRSGRDWFQTNAPRLSAIADATVALPPVREVMARHRLL